LALKASRELTEHRAPQALKAQPVSKAHLALKEYKEYLVLKAQTAHRASQVLKAPPAFKVSKV
jgi:hypothetical protein